jgi:hypothetical protein
MRASTFAAVAIVATIAACSSPQQANDDFQAGQVYHVTGLRVLPNGTDADREFSLSLGTVTTDKVAYTVVSGDVSGQPVAGDTARGSAGVYDAQWHGSSNLKYTLHFQAGSCTGADINADSTTTPWVTCSIRRSL